MKKIANFCIFILIFAAQLTAQEPACLPKAPNFGYTSTLQISEDERVIKEDYTFIQIAITKDSIVFSSDFWDDVQYITEGWELVPVRRNPNGVMVYEWQGRSETAFYRIPVVYKNKKWMTGYLTEKLCIGPDYTVYRNNNTNRLKNQ